MAQVAAVVVQEDGIALCSTAVKKKLHGRLSAGVFKKALAPDLHGVVALVLGTQIPLYQRMAFKGSVPIEVCGKKTVSFEVIGHAQLFAVAAADAEAVNRSCVNARLEGGALRFVAFVQ